MLELRRTHWRRADIGGQATLRKRFVPKLIIVALSVTILFFFFKEKPRRKRETMTTTTINWFIPGQWTYPIFNISTRQFLDVLQKGILLISITVCLYLLRLCWCPCMSKGRQYTTQGYNLNITVHKCCSRFPRDEISLQARKQIYSTNVNEQGAHLFDHTYAWLEKCAYDLIAK